jgi:hypothetical protein
VSRDDPAAEVDILGELTALRIGERCNVWKDQYPEPCEGAGFEKVIVDDLERDSGFDQRLVVAELRPVSFRVLLPSVIKRRSLIRDYDRHPREVGARDQVALIGCMPLIDIRDDGHPTLVEGLGVELTQPRAKTLSDTFPIGRPTPDGPRRPPRSSNADRSGR